MFYKRLLELKEDIQSIIDLEAAHRYLRLLESTPTLHVQVLQRVFLAEFGDSYTLLNVYNIFEKLELAHAHYEGNAMKPPSCSKPQPRPAALTKSAHSSSRTKVVYSVAPILPSCNYCGNHAHKVRECNIPSKDLFCDYCEKMDIMKLFVLPSSRNENNSDYHDKFCQHLSLPLKQKPKHLSLPLKLSPPKVILIKMVRKRNTMLTRQRCFKPMPLKFKLYKMNSIH